MTHPCRVRNFALHVVRRLYSNEGSHLRRVSTLLVMGEAAHAECRPPYTHAPHLTHTPGGEAGVAVWEVLNRGSCAVRNLNRALIAPQMAIAPVGEKGAKYETNLCQPCMSRSTYPRLGYSRPHWDARPSPPH